MITNPSNALWDSRYGYMPEPHLDPRFYHSYIIRRPMETHSRTASCEEYQCDAFMTGFVTTVYLNTELGQAQWEFLTHDKTRKYSLQRPSLSIAKFIYGPGNNCFAAEDGRPHRVFNTRPPRMLVLGGDWRGNPNGLVRQHTKIEHWTEDFAINQAILQKEFKKG